MNVNPNIPSELYGDKTRIRGILINLLSNAVKYTEQGSVVFTIRLLETNHPYVTLEFSIRDTGIGIKESAIEHLFDKFARFDSKRNTHIEGTGLGLSIVKHGAVLHDASISLSSKIGEGTDITLQFTKL